MATARRGQRSRRQTLSGGPWRGVRDTTDPFDDTPNELVDAQNCYIPDPQGGSGLYARPGFQLLNNGNPIYSSATAFKGNAIYTHTSVDGQTYNFIAIAGKLFRVDGTFSVFTDVSPVGITIDASLSTRVAFASLDGQLVVTDGVNRPWVASNLSSTPITGTYISIDGGATAWSATDVTAFSGAVVFKINEINGVFAQTDIVWSAPADPASGYQQPNYDYRWTLEQTGTTPIYAIEGTNIGLYYWREASIGLASGALGPNFATNHTDDAVSFNIGTLAPQSVQKFGVWIYFTDAIGRPYRLQLGSAPEPIWLNMRAIVDASTTAYPGVTSITTTSAFEPTLNLYHIGVWSPTPSGLASPVEWYAFDGKTGIYLGRWSIASGIAVDCLGIFTDDHGRGTLIVMQEGGYVWSFNANLGVPDFLTTEAGVLLTTEGAGRLTSEGQEEIWTDNGAVPTISATTQRLGYSEDTVWNVDLCTMITGTDAAVTVTMMTPTTAASVEGSPTPSVSQDGTYRLVCGCDVQGRGTQVTASPTSANNQWSLQRVSIVAVPSMAGPEDA